MLIYIYDVSLEDRSFVYVIVSEYLIQVIIKELFELKSYKLEILVENLGRINIGWDMKKLRKGNSCCLFE